MDEEILEEAKLIGIEIKSLEDDLELVSRQYRECKRNIETKLSKLWLRKGELQRMYGAK